MALATLVVDLILKAAGFESDMGGASKTAQKRMKEIQAEARKLGKAIGVGLSAGATALAIALKGAIDRADELYNAAQKIGVNVEALSGLEYAAKQAGVELEALRGGLGKMIKFQAEAAQGGDKAAATFAAFGIKVKDAAGNLRDTESVLGDFAEVFSQLKDGPEKVALALRVFGRGGAELIPFLNEGRAGIKELTDEARRLGIVIDEETGKRADAFNDTLDKIRGTVTGVATELAIELLPRLQELADQFQEATEKGEAARKIEDVFTVIGTAAKIVAGLVQAVVDVVQALTSTVAAFFSVASANLKLMQLDFDGALEAYKRAKQEFGAALEAGAETRANLGLSIPGIDPQEQAKDMVPEGFRLGRGHGSGHRDSAKVQAAAARLLANEQDKANKSTKAGAEAKRAAAAAAKAQAEREEELREALRKVSEASAEFTTRAEDLAAQRSGPQAEALLQYHRDLKELQRLGEVGERSTAERTKAEADLADAFAKTTAQIEERLHPERKLLEDLNAQLDSLRMLSQEERDRADFLREYTNATDQQADAYARVTAQIRETQEQISVADGFRDHWEDAFASILDGSKSAKEAFSDLAKSILADMARMLARKWVEQLFGQYGTTGGGKGGGFLSWLTGSAQGNAFEHGVAVSAFALGGIVTRPTVFPMAHGMGLMGEAGPEAVMPLSRMANGKLGVSAGGRAPIINISVEGHVTRETQQQIAAKVAQQLAFAGRAL